MIGFECEKMDKKEILLVFPPVWQSLTPPLSTPTLKAFLEKKGFKAEQKDLNTDFWEHFKKEEHLKVIYDNIKKHLIEQKAKKNLTKKETLFYFWLKFISKNSFKEFKEKVLKEEINPTMFRDLCKRFSSYYEEPSKEAEESTLSYHDRLFIGFSESYYTLSSSKLFEHCKSKTNKFRKYFEEILANDLNKFNFPVIGFSLVGANQIVPALTLASLLKENFPETHITVGGPWCTHLFDVIPEKKEFFDLVDSVVFFEGETALAEISKRILEKDSLEGIPNIAFRKGKKIIRNKIVCNQNLDELPAPNFDGLVLEKYLLKNVLTLQTSRGCFWGKCIFCSYPFFEPKYKERKIELVLEDIKKLKEKYGTKCISFVDSSMRPERLEELAKALIESKIDIEYFALARFNKKIIPVLGLLKQSGCKKLLFGMESASPRILNVINKGINLANAKEILKETKKAGIMSQISLIYGLPTETFDDIKKTLNFLRENKGIIDSFIYAKFSAEKHSLIEQQQKELGIKLKKNSLYDLDLGYVFESKTLTKKELKNAEKELMELSWRYGL